MLEFLPPDIHLISLLPVAVVVVTGIVVLLSGTFRPSGPNHTLRQALVGLGLAAVASLLAVPAEQGATFAGMLQVDALAVFFYLVFLLTTAVGVVLAVDHLRDYVIDLSEAVALLLLCCAGMMLMASSANLLMIFLGLETMSIALYVMAGLAGPKDRGSSEAALKYLLLGAFATGFLLYGIAFIYGAGNTLDLTELAAKIAGGAVVKEFLLIGLALVVVGLGFKVAVVPFHMWAPDVYDGAPTAIAAFMTVGPKIAGFAAFLRVINQAAGDLQGEWSGLLWVLSAATVIVANAVALSQTNIKRMLAYSSVAHAGYLLIGVTAGGQAGAEAVLFYSLAYVLMNLGAFAVVLMWSGAGRDRLALTCYQGLAKRQPLCAAAMALFMFSLAGLPPFSGFLAKWQIFAAAVQADYVGLAVVGVLGSVISAFYYLRVVVLMYFGEPEGELAALPQPDHTRLALTVAAVGTLLASVPGGFLLMRWAGAAVGLG